MQYPVIIPEHRFRAWLTEFFHRNEFCSFRKSQIDVNGIVQSTMRVQVGYINAAQRAGQLELLHPDLVQKVVIGKFVQQFRKEILAMAA